MSDSRGYKLNCIKNNHSCFMPLMLMTNFQIYEEPPSFISTFPHKALCLSSTMSLFLTDVPPLLSILLMFTTLVQWWGSWKPLLLVVMYWHLRQIFQDVRVIFRPLKTPLHQNNTVLQMCREIFFPIQIHILLYCHIFVPCDLQSNF